VFFHRGGPALGDSALRTDRDLEALRAAAAGHLSPAGQLQVATALDMLAGLDITVFIQALFGAAEQFKPHAQLGDPASWSWRFVRPVSR
jgi:hypothetical protein